MQNLILFNVGVIFYFAYIFCCSVTKLCPTLCHPIDCSMPGFPVLHYLLELLRLTSTESVISSNHLIHCLPLPALPSVFPNSRVFSSESPFCIMWPNFWSFRSVTVLPGNIQGWFPLELIGLISVQSKELSRVFSSTTVWKHQFLDTQSFVSYNSHTHIWPLEKP